MSARDELLNLRSLSVTYHVRNGLKRVAVHAVKNFSMSIGHGEVVGLIGESGSGKTTITNSILGMADISGGSIAFNGRVLCDAVANAKRALRDRDIQVVLQDPMSSFNPRYTIRSSLAVPLKLKGSVPKDSMEERLNESVRRVGLSTAVLDRYPHQLSGGQLQRLSIARAISGNPKLLIADEPASKLDVSVRAQVLNLLKDLARDNAMAMLLITHDLDVARFLCHRVSVMHFGELVEEGKTADVFSRPSKDYTRSLLSDHVAHQT